MTDTSAAATVNSSPEKKVPFSIGKKITLSFAAILVLFVSLGAVIIVNVRSMNREASYDVKYKDLQAVISPQLGERVLDPKTGRFQRKLNQDFAVTGDVVTKRKEEALIAEINTRNTIIIVILFSFLLSAVVGAILIRNIIAPLKKMMVSMQKISQGELTAQVEVSTRDEFGQLAKYFNEMAAQLQKSRQALEEQMEIVRQLSLTDPLTGLYNRRGFMSLVGHQINVAIREKKKISIIYADMDNLKTINDKKGHLAGDEALNTLATFFKYSFRRSDITARVGGDEFAASIIDSQEEGALKIKQHLVDSIRDFNESRHPTYPVEMSLGVMVFDPETSSDIDSMLLQVDKLMYEDKVRRKAERAKSS